MFADRSKDVKEVIYDKDSKLVENRLIGVENFLIVCY